MDQTSCGANNCPLAPVWTRAEVLSLVTLLINVLLGVVFGSWISLTNLRISRTNLKISQANTRPLLRFVAVNTSNKVQLRIVNHGKGPAIITRLHVTGRVPTDQELHAQYIVTSTTARRKVSDVLKPDARVEYETVIRNQVVKADDREGLTLLLAELTNYHAIDTSCQEQWQDYLEPIRHDLGHSHLLRFTSKACFKVEYHDLLGNLHSWEDCANVFDPGKQHRGGRCRLCDAELGPYHAEAPADIPQQTQAQPGRPLQNPSAAKPIVAAETPKLTETGPTQAIDVALLDPASDRPQHIGLAGPWVDLSNVVRKPLPSAEQLRSIDVAKLGSPSGHDQV